MAAGVSLLLHTNAAAAFLYAVPYPPYLRQMRSIVVLGRAKPITQT